MTTVTTAEDDASDRIAVLEKKVGVMWKKNDDDYARFSRMQASVDSLLKRAEILESRLTDLRVEFDEQIRTIAAQGITVYSP